MLAFNGPVLPVEQGDARRANEHASIRLESRLTRWVEQEGDGDLSSVATPEKLVGDRDPAGAVKRHRSAVPQTKSRHVTIMLGDDARNRAMSKRNAARLRLGGPIERARGTARGRHHTGQSVVTAVCLKASRSTLREWYR